MTLCKSEIRHFALITYVGELGGSLVKPNTRSLDVANSWAQLSSNCIEKGVEIVTTITCACDSFAILSVMCPRGVMVCGLV